MGRVMLTNSNVQTSLKRLIDGNARFVSGLRSVESLSSIQKLRELAEKGQKPFAAVIGCADSRAPAELVFDCGLGELFVCRVAGNIATPWIIGSIEYAALKLGTALCVILGHSSCGAVGAALEGVPAGAPRHLRRLVAGVRLSISEGRDLGNGGGLDAAVWRNVDTQREKLLSKSPELRGLHEKGAFGVVGAFYDLRTGVVSFSEKEGAGRKAAEAVARRA